MPYWIASAQQFEIQNIIVICDSQKRSEKLQMIWEERTGSSIEEIDNESTNIYMLREKPIPFYFIENHNSDALIQITKLLDINCLFNAETPRKLFAQIINSMRNGVVNVHPGLLQEYRGCTSVEWSIFNDN